MVKFISKMCSEGYIPQEKYEEQETLFRNDDGKWINGKYYTKDELEKMKKIMAMSYSHFFLLPSILISLFISTKKEQLSLFLKTNR